jgi:predicted nucleic acid-binding Zn ribbon protein
MRRRKSEPEAIARLVPRVLEDLGFGGSARIVRVAKRWEEALGAETARHCRPLLFRGEVLDAEVDSSVRCQELKLRAPQLLAALRRTLGDDAPAELRFRVG